MQISQLNPDIVGLRYSWKSKQMQRGIVTHSGLVLHLDSSVMSVQKPVEWLGQRVGPNSFPFPCTVKDEKRETIKGAPRL